MIKKTRQHESPCVERLSYQRLPQNKPRRRSGCSTDAFLRLFFAVSRAIKPTPSPSPQQKCQSLLISALESSRHFETNALYLWMDAKRMCETHHIAFMHATNVELPIGGTALRGLVDTRDHTSLRFVHSSLSPGGYAQNVYLGDFQDDRTKPLPVIQWVLSERPFVAYRGGVKDHLGFSGYGVFHWADHNSYVGEWRSIRNIKDIGTPDADENYSYMHDTAGKSLCFKYRDNPFEALMFAPLRQESDYGL